MSTVPKRIWVVLALSIALNMFCVGVFVARHTLMRERLGHDLGPRAFMHHSGLHNAGPEVQGIMKRHRDEVHERMRALAESRKHVRDALKADPYDQARVETAFSEVRDKSSAMQADMHGVLIEVSKHLGPEQRKRMANALWASRGDVQGP